MSFHNSLFPLFPAPGKHRFSFWFCFMIIGSGIMWHLFSVTGLFNLAWRSQGSSLVSYVAGFFVFFWLNYISVCVYHIFSPSFFPSFLPSFLPFFLSFFYCCSSTVVSIFPHSPLPHLPPPPILSPTPLWLCLWVFTHVP